MTPFSVNPDRTLVDTADTRLGRAVLPLLTAHADKSGIVPLREGRDAFAARSLLADAAERTLDVQYYIWHNDISGGLLFDALRRAAHRGVRVRLLLDDNNTYGLDATLASLDAHANIEVRLFNPFVHRRWRLLDYLTDFARLNRRMHNKSFTADAQVTIVGGRNVGDEYFDAGHDVMFVDLDVLAIGPVVGDVSRDFDRYWHSESSYPVGRVLRSGHAGATDASPTITAHLQSDSDALKYTQAIARQPFVRDVLAGTLAFEWATTTMVSDDPAKGLGRVGDDTLVFTRLKALLDVASAELKIVSPYFVPGAVGVAYLSELVRRGVNVAVLTNALEATDVAAVHAGYAKRRVPLLQAGVALFELKRGASAPARSSRRRTGSVGSSGSSLHAKTFAIDNERVFVGSFNFDPRSARLNTELGFIIDSPVLAGHIAEVFAVRVPDRAYRVELGERGRLEWEERSDHETIAHEDEPRTGWWQRFGVSLLATLPIEWLL